MIVQRERLRHDIRAGAVCGCSVLTGCEALIPTAPRPIADVATAVLHTETLDAADGLRQRIPNGGGLFHHLQRSPTARTVRRMKRDVDVIHYVHRI